MINGDKRGIAAFQSVAGLICIDAGARRCNRLGWRRLPELLIAASAMYLLRSLEFLYEQSRIRVGGWVERERGREMRFVDRGAMLR